MISIFGSHFFGSHFPSRCARMAWVALGGAFAIQGCTVQGTSSFSWDSVVHLSGPSVVSITAWRSGPSEHAEVFRGAPLPARDRARALPLVPAAPV